MDPPRAPEPGEFEKSSATENLTLVRLVVELGLPLIVKRGPSRGDAILAGKMGGACTLEACTYDSNAEALEASVEATGCEVDTDDLMPVMASETNVLGPVV